jgi:hypothetical protein
MSVLRAETRLHRGQMRELLVRGITRDEWESLRS